MSVLKTNCRWKAVINKAPSSVNLFINNSFPSSNSSWRMAFCPPCRWYTCAETCRRCAFIVCINWECVSSWCNKRYTLVFWRHLFAVV